MSRRDDDLDEEIRSHLAMAKRDRIERGESPDAADSAARREFGNTTRVKEITREIWGWNSFETLLQDLRYGLRTMRRSPGFAVVATLSLALGIGANTAIFSLIHALILRALPVQQPEALVEILTNRGRGRGNSFSWQTYQYFRDHNQTLSDLLASYRDHLYTSAEGLETQYVEGQFVTGNYFPMLGVRPALGRLISPQDDRVGAPAPVAVVSWSYWKNRLGLDPGVLGRKITVENTPVTIIGVAPRGFFGTQVGWSEDIFVPLALERVIRGPRTFTHDAGYKWLQFLGRRKPGVSLDRIRAEMNVLHRRTLEIEALERHESKIPDWTIDVGEGAAGLARMRDEFSKPLLVLMAIVGILLLIACANVAGMLLARGAAREREIALRVSLGAGRFRLLRQLLTESLLLSAAAAALGVVLAFLGSNYLLRAMAAGRARLELQVAPNGPVLLFTTGVALLTGLLFGSIPALRAMRASLAPATRQAARGGETRARRLFGKSLIVVQVAFSVVLLTAAGIFVRNLSTLENLDLGIQRGGVLMIALDPSHSGYPDEQLTRVYQRLLARFESLPGVRSASICWMPPISGGGSDGTVVVEGSSVSVYAYKNWVAPRYFETVGMPLLAGRDFTMDDRTGSNLVAVINQTMARRAFGAANPLGRRLTFKPYPGSYEIIGIVGDAKYMWLREATTATAYLDAFQQQRPTSQFVIRAAVPPARLIPAARREIRDVAPAVLTGKVATLAEHIDSAIVNERLIAMLSSLFGALGSLLAAIGLYGLLAYTVARRTNEIGIRMALGARRVDVLRMVVREALLTVSAGLAIGIPFALAAAQAAGKIFADLPPRNLPIAISGAAAMLAVAAAAAYLPARRAVRVDPMEALRYE